MKPLVSKATVNLERERWKQDKLKRFRVHLSYQYSANFHSKPSKGFVHFQNSEKVDLDHFFPSVFIIVMKGRYLNVLTLPSYRYQSRFICVFLHEYIQFFWKNFFRCPFFFSPSLSTFVENQLIFMCDFMCRHSILFHKPIPQCQYHTPEISCFLQTFMEL